MDPTRVNVLDHGGKNVPVLRTTDSARPPGTTGTRATVVHEPLNTGPERGTRLNVQERTTGDVPTSMTVLLTMFLITLNCVGIFGQSMWFHDEITSGTTGNDRWLWAPSITASLIVEMFGVYLSFMAHQKIMNDQAAFRTRLASYAIGAGVGYLTYVHFDRSQMTSIGIVLGGASALSPWMWAIYSEYRYRADRMARGLTDPRAVKLSSARMFWHPRRSLGVLSWASWAGESRPDVAVAGWEASRRRRGETNGTAGSRRAGTTMRVVQRRQIRPTVWVPSSRRMVHSAAGTSRVVSRPDHGSALSRTSPEMLPPGTSQERALPGAGVSEVVPSFVSELPADLRARLDDMVMMAKVPVAERRAMVDMIREVCPRTRIPEIAEAMGVSARALWKAMQ